MDINGERPEIYICTGNRTAGKTTFFNRYFVKRFKEHGEKFALLYRYNYELDDVADKFFKDIGGLFFKGFRMRSEKMAKGIFHVLYLQFPPDEGEEEGKEEVCGYAITLNSADQLKKYSHYFSDVQRILFDEFQSETNHYCANEVTKFQSIHTSIARGQGAMNRRVPVVMISNTVSSINPYFVALGISNRINKQTKFLRGEGFVLEQTYNPDAANALKQSAFMRAFSNKYASYAADGNYLNDSEAFIDKMPENGRYIMTIKYEGKSYSVKEYPEKGVIYVSDSIDNSFPLRITVDIADHDVNYLMIGRHSLEVQQLRESFDMGSVRFKNQMAKNAFLALICYNVV